MLRVKYERYLNDFHHKSETKSFADLIELESWMFGQMQQDYSGDKGAMSFPTPRKAKRIGENGPWCIELRPVYGEEQIWIHQIETPNGIIFSDGRFTSGKKYWTGEVQEWLMHCEQRRKNPQFNFAADDSKPKRSLWLRLGVTVSITANEEADIFGEDAEKAAKMLQKLIAAGRFTPSGDCYVPDPIVEQFNKDYGTDYIVQDINFEM